jgi:hypothetical protein
MTTLLPTQLSVESHWLVMTLSLQSLEEDISSFSHSVRPREAFATVVVSATHDA